MNVPLYKTSGIGITKLHLNLNVSEPSNSLYLTFEIERYLTIYYALSYELSWEIDDIVPFLIVLGEVWKGPFGT